MVPESVPGATADGTLARTLEAVNLETGVTRREKLESLQGFT